MLSIPIISSANFNCCTLIALSQLQTVTVHCLKGRFYTLSLPFPPLLPPPPSPSPPPLSGQLLDWYRSSYVGALCPTFHISQFKLQTVLKTVLASTIKRVSHVHKYRGSSCLHNQEGFSCIPWMLLPTQSFTQSRFCCIQIVRIFSLTGFLRYFGYLVLNLKATLIWHFDQIPRPRLTI